MAELGISQGDILVELKNLTFENELRRNRDSNVIFLSSTGFIDFSWFLRVQHLQTQLRQGGCNVGIEPLV
jgi:hypothetical protein